MDEADSEDLEALVPGSRAIFGLKVADEEEATTVRRVSMATVGFSVLLLLDFFVHSLHDGNALHWLSHLMLPGLLFAAGGLAITKRSTRATWVFHVGSVLLGFTHTILLGFVMLSLSVGEVQGAACGIRPHCPSKGSAPWIVLWFIIVSLPVMVLSLFAAYHSQDFYMQLRLRGFTARSAGGSQASAVVYQDVDSVA
eukprot:CAMPEP_0175522922 /NCGR_PEP_ID=MMETSP0096-20121207/17796_1 /TAXON_ID=311494 /ORGANISM="Alexandrium monilatum, Strain CCMP3105" /LENGTH=196 /DNA_ID=CAMNT_0016825429 /DNA_START=59 /DNA_END=646 /DNA_ORIENTATION=+